MGLLLFTEETGGAEEVNSRSFSTQEFICQQQYKRTYKNITINRWLSILKNSIILVMAKHIHGV